MMNRMRQMLAMFPGPIGAPKNIFLRAHGLEKIAGALSPRERQATAKCEAVKQEHRRAILTDLKRRCKPANPRAQKLARLEAKLAAAR